MVAPEGTKFIFFIIPVFIIAIIVVFLIFSNRSQDQKESITENIYGTDTGEDIDFKELKIETLEEGSGKETEVGDEISANYIGTLKDGTQFDSSYDRGEPFTFVLGIGQVIDGWDQGLVGMKVGEKRRLEIPSSLGYGEYGSGIIPGDTGLIFEVELVSINN